MKSWLKKAICVACIIVITASVSVAVTVSVMNNNREDSIILNTEEYADMQRSQIFSELIEKITEYSLNDSIDSETLIRCGASGMVDALDDKYAQYYTAEEYTDYMSKINGEYNGIGILVGQPDEAGAPVLDVYEGNPAAEAGLLAGDILIEANGTKLSGLTLEELVAAIDTQIGDKVQIKALRSGVEMEFSVTSAQINIRRVEHALFNERTGYIRIDMFTGNCVTEFNEAMRDLTERGMRSLVIDLRNNPGGSLNDVVDIADTLLGEGVIVSIKGRDDSDETVYRASGQGINVPLAIIVNENSASASEILAGAIQANGAGAIVGMTTYGKGVVQTTMHLDSNGGWIKLTTDAYFTPDGKSIDGVGITPDIEIDLPEELKGIAIRSLDQDSDAQLWEALDYVRELAD